MNDVRLDAFLLTGFCLLFLVSARETGVGLINPR